MPMYLMSYTTR